MMVALESGGFAAIFASPTLVELLRVFLLRPADGFYQRELAGLTGSRLAQVQRDLLRLEGAGLVERRRHGNRVYYRAATGHPAFADLQSMIVKTVGVADLLHDALRPTPEQIDLAFVYGSVAEGRELAASDIDVFVVSRHDPREVTTRLTEAGERLGREVNVTVYGPEELRTKLAAEQPFLNRVTAGPKLWLVGDQAALEALLGGHPPAGD